MPLAQPMFIWGCAGAIVLVAILTSPIWVKASLAAYRTLASAVRDSAKEVASEFGGEKEERKDKETK